MLYEQVREKVLAGKDESHRLHVPEPVALTAAEAGAALDVKETLAEIGIEIEPFGGDTVVISAYPAMLAAIERSRSRLWWMLAQRRAARRVERAAVRVFDDELG